ncbi:hypothetical protein AHF37_05729 [Paragonimus kellicotti]|nr:hypothetical protein AHF37_05729 [Paragonimus kellicotti]
MCHFMQLIVLNFLICRLPSPDPWPKSFGCGQTAEQSGSVVPKPEKFVEVEMSFRKALDIYLKQYKPSSPIVLRAKNNLASALLKRGYASDAEILLKAVLSPDQSTQRSSYHTWNNTGALSTTEADSAVFLLFLNQ